MNDLSQFPLLRQLSAVERSKLLPNVTEISLAPGQRLGPVRLKQAIYFVLRGRVELRYREENSDVRVFTLGAQEFLGETALCEDVELPLEVISLEHSVLAAVPAAVFLQLLRNNPSILEAFTRNILHRLSGNLEEIAHLRRVVAVYTDLLKQQAQVLEPTAETASKRTAAAVMPAAVPEGGPDPGSPAFKFSRNYRLTGLILASVAGVLLMVLPNRSGMDLQTRRFLAIMAWGAICWLFNALPDYVVGLSTCLGLAVTGMSTVAWSGFSNPTWFLLLGVWAIGVAASRTGLLYRMALYCLKFAPPTYAGRSLALALAGVVMTPLLPSPQGRIAMAAPLTQELSEAMRFPRFSRGSAGLAMSTFLGFGEMYFLFLNGTTTTLLAWSLLPESIRTSVNWTYWLIAALPLGLGVFVFSFWAIMRMLPADKVDALPMDVITKQLSVLGPMHREERVTLLVILGLLVAFMTASLHGVDSAWFAMGGMLVLVATNVLDRDALSKDVNWSFLLFFGSVMGIATAARQVHLDVALGQMLKPLLLPALPSPLAAVAVVGVLTLVLRLVLSSIQVIPLLTIVLTPIFAAAGYNPFGIMMVVVAASTTFAAPLLSPAYVSMLAGTRESMFTDRQIRPLALIHSLIVLVGMLASVPYWIHIHAL